MEHKDTFVRLVSENDSLHLVEMPGWAGLGGVRYAPPTWIHVMTDQAKEELNRLNTQLVETIRSTDAAFSLGEGADGLACVRFGMVTQDTGECAIISITIIVHECPAYSSNVTVLFADVAELLTLVLQVGQEVEASSKMLDTISEVVKRGIETAQIDLERENAEKLWQEGILRHVPVVGTFVNWWSPPSKETGVRGRSLNLQAGKCGFRNFFFFFLLAIVTHTVSYPLKQVSWKVPRIFTSIICSCNQISQTATAPALELRRSH